MKTVVFIIFCLLFIKATSQDLQEGFTYLETGRYPEAERFFKNVIHIYPTNKTALLCYGRAIGLNGNAPKAKMIFTDLVKTYPENFELALNYAESLLWNRDFVEAQSHYEKLIHSAPESFSALLGYANTLSNLKKYSEALIVVHKALAIDSVNTNALISRKYIRLGQAAQWQKEGKIHEAINIIQSNFMDFPNDQDSLLNLINIYLITNQLDFARQAYETITDRVTRDTGLALLAHKQSNDKEALLIAEKVYAFAKASSTPLSIIKASERYVQALIWNAHYKKAETVLKTLHLKYLDSIWVWSLEATLYTYRGQFSKSIETYQHILQKDSTSFDGNLGIANAYRAKGQPNLAKTYALKTLTYYPAQRDAQQLINILQTELQPTLQSIVNQTTDNGGNEAYAYHVSATFPISHHLKASVGYAYRTTENVNTFEMAKTQTFQGGASYRIHHNTWAESDIQLIKATIGQNDYTGVTGKLSITARPWALQYLKVGYQRELQNFNATLINESLYLNNYSLNYNMGTTYGLGWYTGYTYTHQTDGNTRNLLFTSLYYHFTKKPLIKGGINYQYLSFNEQVPALYFSPEKYHAIEIFTELSGKLHKINYYANTAIGYQFVNEDPSSFAFRLEGRLSYQFATSLQLGIYGKYSNVASATATGFEFMDLGLKLNWRL